LSLANPFVRIPFDPPAANYWGVNETDGPVELSSLRRRFVLSEDEQYILMTRVYKSKQFSASAHACSAGSVRTHVRCRSEIDNDPVDTDTADTDVPVPEICEDGNFKTAFCDAILFNAAGAGVCLYYDTGTESVQFADSRDYWRWGNNPFNMGGVDHFLWRRLVNRANNDARSYFFSPKCYGFPACETASRIYLPDYEVFFDMDILRGPAHDYDAAHYKNAIWLSTADANTGLVLYAVKDVVLQSFMVHSQGVADTVKLLDASGNAIPLHTCAVAAGQTEQSCDVNWLLSEGTTYKLISTAANHKYRAYSDFPVVGGHLVVESSCSDATCSTSDTANWNNFTDFATVEQ
jgi:hypothetical protein